MKRNLAQHFAQLSLVAVGVLALAVSAQAQSRTQIEAPWRIGLNAGLNYNFGAFGYQNLQPDGTTSNFAPFVANDGTGIGPYIGLMAEYNSKNWWGAQLRASFDVRNTKVTDPTFGYDKTFDTRSSYVTIEPMLRLNLVSKSPFYMTFGPLFGINMSGEYDFTDPNPFGQPSSATAQEITDINSLTVGFGGGFSYDFVLNDRMADLRWYLAPWIESSWMLHQRGITIIEADQDKFDDIWSTPNIRAGIALKMGIMPPLDKVATEDGSGIINLALATPAGGYLRQRQFEEFFPVINAVFFDSTSADIPSRYEQISSSDIATFNENDLMDSTEAGKIDLTKRRAAQMNIYHNVMNIIGTRMKADPSSTVKLSGAAGPYGAKDGASMASKVKDYLVNTVGIDASRISVEDRELPAVPSGSARTPAEDRPLVNAENRRVDLVTSPIKNEPVRITSIETSSIENDLVLNVEEGKIASWQVKITGEGKELTYGPFDHANQRIDSREMMKDLKKGKYTAEVIATTTDGQVIRQTKDFELVRKDGLSKPARRFTIVFPYGSDDPVRLYDTFLKTIVAPRIDDGSTVYVIGHTDAVGNADVNYRLSKSRAGEVRDMLKGETGKTGKTVTYEVVGYGEEQSQLSFDNSMPEGRQYNRGVMIEVIPND